MDSREFLEEFCSQWLLAWNSHSSESVLRLLDDEIEWDDRVFWPRIIYGKEELRKYLAKIWEIMHDVHFEETERFFSPDNHRGIVLFRQQGTGPYSWKGGHYDTHGCDIFLSFRNGRLKHYLGSYEISEMMRQIGMLPPREGRIGGAYFMSLLGGN